MKNDSPKNLDCKFAPEIVEYLYDEIGDERKNSFELHLNNCADCADKIEDFSDIRFSIQDWKAAEFDKLATPAFYIPYENPAIKTVGTERSASWFDTVRNYFSLSPVLSGAMAVLLIALLTSLGALVLENNERDLVADSNRNPVLDTKPFEQPKPSVETANEEIKTTPEVVRTEDGAIEEKPLTEKQVTKVSAPFKNKTNAQRKIQPVKTIEKNTPTVELKKDNNFAVTVPTKNKPRLNELPEEVEDNSLRLADLFAELDTKE